MIRDIDLKEISDGRIYTLNDMVKADCQDCTGCWDCCQGMGESITVDPMDAYRLCLGTGQPMTELLKDKLELHVVDGMVLPNLKLAGEKESCAFLNGQGRCSIHSYRPGICRLFPLGRIYEDGTVRYFLQVHECRKKDRTKVKVKKWIDVPESRKYEQFVVDWHYFLLDLQEKMARRQEEAFQREVNMLVLNRFYLTPYDLSRDFYEQFYGRLKEAGRELLGK